MRSALSHQFLPREKQDFILMHLYGVENTAGTKLYNCGGARIDFAECFMNYDPSFFGLEYGQKTSHGSMESCKIKSTLP
jgi:hypothetical protein